MGCSLYEGWSLRTAYAMGVAWQEGLSQVRRSCEFHYDHESEARFGKLWDYDWMGWDGRMSLWENKHLLAWLRDTRYPHFLFVKT